MFTYSVIACKLSEVSRHSRFRLAEDLLYTEYVRPVRFIAEPSAPVLGVAVSGVMLEEAYGGILR